MPRPRSETKFHVYSRSNNPTWWVWYWPESSKEGRKRIRISTASLVTGPLSQDDYTLEQAQKLVNQTTGSKQEITMATSKLSVAWTIEYMEDRIAVEGKKRSTWDHYRSSLYAFRDIHGESFSLSKFKSTDVFEFQRAVLATGKSPSTVNTYCRGMAGIYHRLKKSGLIQENPFEEFEAIREPKRDHLIKKDDRKRFLEVLKKMKNKDAARLILILAYTGMRRSEVLNLHRNDVDLINNRFQVTNIKSRVGEKRWMTIPKKVRGCFAYFMEHEGDYPFRVCQPNCLGRWARACMKDAGLPYHTHDLRHTFLTLVLDKKTGCSIRDAQHLAGHKDVKTTEIYAHDAADCYETPDIDF